MGASWGIVNRLRVPFSYARTRVLCIHIYISNMICTVLAAWRVDRYKYGRVCTGGCINTREKGGRRPIEQMRNSGGAASAVEIYVRRPSYRMYILYTYEVYILLHKARARPIYRRRRRRRDEFAQRMPTGSKVSVRPLLYYVHKTLRRRTPSAGFLLQIAILISPINRVRAGREIANTGIRR